VDSDWFASLTLVVESIPPDLAHRKFHWNFSPTQKTVVLYFVYGNKRESARHCDGPFEYKETTI
jgi:hypothetical protein